MEIKDESVGIIKSMLFWKLSLLKRKVKKRKEKRRKLVYYGLVFDAITNFFVSSYEQLEAA